MHLEGRCAIVTGAAMGIGRGVALRLAREGASVVVSDVDRDAGQRVVDEMERDGGRALLAVADVAREEDVAALFDVAEQAFGPVALLVNNAGGAAERHFPFADSAEWRKVMEVNLLGVMYGIHHAVKSMTASVGVIVTIASSGGIGFQPYELADYGAAKGGVVRLTSSLGTLAASHGIRVNAICPGWVDTPASRRSREALPAEEQPDTLLTPGDIADAVMYFVGDDTLAGRVMLWEAGELWSLVPLDSRP